MKNGLNKIILLSILVFAGNAAHAQSGETGSNYLAYILLAVAVLIFFVLIVQISESLMAIEARHLGADKEKTSFSLFPNWNELFPKKLPEYVNGDPVHILKRGFDILLEGEAEAVVKDTPGVATFAVQPSNFIGIKPIPKMMVEVGDEVKAGDPLFFDKGMPEIKYCAPVSGEIVAINRGAKRSITEVVILADKEMKYRDYPAFDLEKGSREELVEYLLDSGFWPLIRQRPYNVIADPAETPRDIFISTFDSAPLAPDLNLVVEGREEVFQKGLDVLGKLTSGGVYLGLNATGEKAPSHTFTEARGVEKHWFKGQHPAGNVGVQIHHIAPINQGDKVWTLGVQEVITLGALFQEGRFDMERVVVISGAELKEPKYVRTYAGAKIADLIGNNLSNDHVRIISGDVLSGERKTEDQFLNIYDDQITVIEEGDFFEMFGWLLPLTPRPSISRTYPNFIFPDVRFRANSNTHGEKRAFVVTDDYERVMPMDIYTQDLMKSILINDFEQMEGLGIYELVEEDVALCEFVCVSKQPLQQILRTGLDTMREQG